MKIPAHLASPAANNSKGASNAPLQSVADFLNDHSETPKDFFTALKSLQKMVKPQKVSEAPADVGKEISSLVTKSAATKVAELKLGDPKRDGVEPQELEADISQELDHPREKQSLKVSEALPDIKPATGEQLVVLDDNSKAHAGEEIPEDAEQKLAMPDEVELESKLAQDMDDDLVKVFGVKAPIEVTAVAMPRERGSAGVKEITQSLPKPETLTEAIAQPPKSEPVPLTQVELNTSRAAESAAPLVQVQRPAMNYFESSRRTKAAQEEGGRAPSVETRPIELPVSQNAQTLAKSEAKIEVPLNPRSAQAEVSVELKTSPENVSHIQLKSGNVTQTSSANQPMMQAQPPIPAKEISAQITRHLNSELLNMDLRTQLVSERASPGAINSSVLTLQLHPIGLGRVQAEIRKEGELVRIKLTVEAKGTFDIMKNDIDALKTAMRALGTAEGDVTLTQGNISRLPNDAANNGQSFFSNERGAQSELREQQDQRSDGRSEQQSGNNESPPVIRNSDQILLDGHNTVFI